MAAHSDTANHPGEVPRHPAAQAQAFTETHPEDEAHTSFIRTPKQLIVVVLLALFIPIFIILLLANFVVTADRTGAGADAMTPEATIERIRPVARLELRDASAPQVARAGEEVYKAVCGACHAAGVAGAPKTGDGGAWTARVASGLETLVNSALKGKGAMPPQGGGDFSDLEVAKAVVYMANASGGKFEEPKAPAPAAQAEGDAKPPAQ
ncbi:MAG TPA: c-type cytochrome [Lautropia sp.]|nr:c-type cytochrome [Lautropia sp.]